MIVLACVSLATLVRKPPESPPPHFQGIFPQYRKCFPVRVLGPSNLRESRLHPPHDDLSAERALEVSCLHPRIFPVL